MQNSRLLNLIRWNERLTTFILHLIASLMVGCVIVSIVQLGEFLFMGWQGDYLDIL